MVASAADLAGRAARRAIGSAVGIRRRRGLSRAPHHVAAPHRSAAARRSSRHRAAVRRARVLDSAPSPEGRRREPVARGVAGAAAAHDDGRRVGREGGRLHQRRHDRVPARRGRLVLLPRDEHAPAGRASDHRDGDGRRPGAVADSHRARRAARSRSRSAAHTRRRTRSNAASTRRIPTTASCRRRAASRDCACRKGPGVRDDSGAYEGGEVPIFYDPMISKLITWGDTREHAMQRMRRALAEYQVRGIRTTIPFFQWILDDEDFKAARFDTGFIDRKLGKGPLQAIDASHEDLAAIAAAVHLFTKPVSQRRGRAAPRAAGATPAARKRCDDFRGRDRRQACAPSASSARAALLHVDLDGRTHIVDARRVSDVGRVDAGAARRCGARRRDRSMPRSPPQAGRRRLRRASRRPHHPGADPPGRLVRASEKGRRRRARRPGRSASSRRCRARWCACWSSRATR